jgi:hypothetical protein
LKQNCKTDLPCGADAAIITVSLHLFFTLTWLSFLAQDQRRAGIEQNAASPPAKIDTTFEYGLAAH